MTTQTSGTTNTIRPKLRRSVRDRMLGGVCGGLGEYFGIDPVLVRLAFVLTTLAGGAGVLAYLVMLVAVPTAEAGDAGVTGENAYIAIGDRARLEGKQIGALALIAVGALLLLGNLGWLTWLRGELIWPVLLMALGAVLLLSRRAS